MQIHDYYYEAKPFIPWKLRMMARRLYLSRRMKNCAGIWPIDETAGRKPDGWPGWPDGKKFAFVLTHDVEGQHGLAKCERLMQLEKDLGFRSCFNFIPEGEYNVSDELRATLAANDFEVGVHDLYHDGKLYRSREGFARSAVLINKYLDAWGAVGFRSGFMHHNLEWLHDLNIAYDCSTFDTDPFEPMPDGVGTIFPFWVTPPSHRTPVPPYPRTPGSPSDCTPVPPYPRTTGSPSDHPTVPPYHRTTGYLELPYTLPQDSTMFFLFKEKNTDKWKQKLDWIASKGGMALLNVHPDYMHFDSNEHQGAHFPASLYREFLAWVKTRYQGQYWQATPKEIAAYCSMSQPQRPRTPRRICMLTHSSYSTDARVTRYAEALGKRGDHVDVLALRNSPDQPVEERVGNVNLVRLQDRYAKNEKSRLSFLVPILRFLVAGSLWIRRSHRRQPYDLLHIHNVPDFLVFTALFPRLTGAKVILDIHDIVPEFYASKFKKSETSLLVRMLKWTEWASAKVAHHVIIANHLWEKKYAERTGSNGKCSVYINNVDTDIFRPIPRTRNDGKIIVLFPGGLQWHQGLDIAIRAFAKVLATLNPDPCPATAGSDLRSPFSALDGSASPSDRTTVPPYHSTTGSPPLSDPCPATVGSDVEGRVTPHGASAPNSDLRSSFSALDGSASPSDRTTVPPYHSATGSPPLSDPCPATAGSALSPDGSAVPPYSRNPVPPSLEFHIYGDGNMKPSLIALAQDLGLAEKVKFFSPLPVRKIAEIMANADLGVVPKRADSFGNEAYSTKIMEFMSLGVPMIVSSTKIDRFYFTDDVVRFFPSGDHDELARQMIDILTDTEARERQIAKARAYAAENSWDNRKHDYLALVDSLIAGHSTNPSSPGKEHQPSLAVASK